MKPAPAFLWMAVALGLGLCASRINSPRLVRLPAVETDSNSTAPESPAAMPRVTHERSPEADFANKFGLIIAKLRQWTEATDSGELEQLERELAALRAECDRAELLRQLPSEMLDTPFAMQALEEWSGRDPAAALDWLAAIAQPNEAQIGMTVDRLLSRDLAGLRNYLADLPSGEWQQQVLRVAVATALRNQLPEDAVAWLGKVAPEKRDPQLWRSAAAVWGQMNFTAALAWADTQTDPILREQLRANVAGGLARSDPVAAVEFIREKLLPGDPLNEAVDELVGAWADSKPAEAAAWVVLFPEGDLRQRALDGLLDHWAKADPAAVRQWVLEQSAGAERDGLLTRLALQQSQDDYAAAADLVARMSPGQIQEDIGAGIVFRWAGDDRGRATTWVAQLPPGPFQQLAMKQLERAAHEP